MSRAGTLNRRSLLQRAVVLVGAGLFPAGCTNGLDKGPNAPLTLSQLSLLSAVADTIIPKTDTPGAIDVGVPEKFDKLMQDWASAERHGQFIAVLEKINGAAMTDAGRSFVELKAAPRLELLSKFDQTHFRTDAQYAKLKELVATLYYLSEPGSTVELSYEHSPGVWEPSVAVTSETRASGGIGLF